MIGDMSQSLGKEDLSGTARETAVAQARALIEKISREHGYVEEKFWKDLSPEARAAFQYALGKKDEMIASSVST